MPAVRGKLAESGNAILESNSILKFLRPDLYLTVLDPATADFKKSAQEFLDRADAVILHQSETTDASVAQNLAETCGGTTHVSHLSAGLCHAADHRICKAEDLTTEDTEDTEKTLSDFPLCPQCPLWLSFGL